MAEPGGEITQLLCQLKTGNQSAAGHLMEMVYPDLRRIARSYMRREAPDHTLQATALVHEVFLKLAGAGNFDWRDRAHFFAVASQLMRRILVDHARAVKAVKRAGSATRLPLESVVIVSEENSADILALDAALERLSELDARQSKIVELRFFGGLTVEEVAEVLQMSARTVKRDWKMARAWLYGELVGGEERASGA